MTTFHTKNCLQGQKNLTVIVILIWKYNTHTKKKYVDDYHTWGTTFYNNNNKIIYRQNCRDSMHYHIILPQNGLPSSFIISRKACEDSWCSLCSLTVKLHNRPQIHRETLYGRSHLLNPHILLTSSKNHLLSYLDLV